MRVIYHNDRLGLYVCQHGSELPVMLGGTDDMAVEEIRSDTTDTFEQALLTVPRGESAFLFDQFIVEQDRSGLFRWCEVLYFEDHDGLYSLETLAAALQCVHTYMSTT